MLELAGLEIASSPNVATTPGKAATAAEGPIFGRRDEEARAPNRVPACADDLGREPVAIVLQPVPESTPAADCAACEQGDPLPALAAIPETIVSLDVAEARSSPADDPPPPIEPLAIVVDADEVGPVVDADDVGPAVEVMTIVETVAPVAVVPVTVEPIRAVAVAASSVASSGPTLTAWLAAYAAATRSADGQDALRIVEPAAVFRVDKAPASQPVTLAVQAKLARAAEPQPRIAPAAAKTSITDVRLTGVSTPESARETRWVGTTPSSPSGDPSSRRARIEAVTELMEFSERPMALQPGFDAAALLRDLHEVMLAERGIVEMWRTMASSSGR